MQVRKEYTHEQIVNVARMLFLRDGFNKTSMRDIANGAGIGVSNLYNYFESKDELFRHILTPLIKEMDSMIRDHHDANKLKEFVRYVKGESDEMMKEHVRSYMRLIRNMHDELELILYKAQGSSLENYIDDYTDKCTRQIVTFMDEFKAQYPDYGISCQEFTYHIHTVWMFNFISEVIKHKLNTKEIEKAVEDYIYFEYHGWRKLMNQ